MLAFLAGGLVSLRIAFLIDRWDPARGGAERAMAKLAQALLERGHDVRAFAAAAAPQAPGVFERVPVRGFTRTGRERRLARDLVAAAEEQRCDVTIGMRHLPRVDLYWPHDGSHEETLRAQREARGLEGLPRRLGRHALFLELESELLDRGGARKVVCVSSLVRDELERHHPACADRLHVIENGVDLAAFHPDRRAVLGPPLREKLGVSARTPLIAFAGSDPIRKGLPTLLAALGRLLSEPWSMCATGMHHPSRWMRAARRQGLSSDRASFHNHVDTRALFAAADLLVLPTWRDASGLVLLEALACGTPVVTTARAGAAEVVASVAAGTVLAEPGDADALARALGAWLERIRSNQVDRAAVREAVAKRGESAWLERLSWCVESLGR